MLITGWTTRGWNLCKQELGFARLTNDGEDKGAFMLERDPTPHEVETIRHRVGLKKRREFDESALATLAVMRDRKSSMRLAEAA
jgi:hypothetical protein